MIEDREVTAKQAAELFGVPVGRIYEWQRAKRLTMVRAYTSRGRKGETAYFRLSEVAGIVAEEHAEKREHASS